MITVILTGFMGTGKSRVGAILADRLGLPLLDIDSLIEESEGRSIREIFEENGEGYFRERERETIAEAVTSPAVIAAGGGAVVSEENRRKLREAGVVVCLSASVETILKRTGGNNDRPLLLEEDRLKTIERLLDHRQEAYADSDLTIVTDQLTPDEVVEKIQAFLDEIVSEEG